MDYVTIGKAVKPHGLKGEIKIYPTTSFLEERFKKNSVILVHTDEGLITVHTSSFRHSDKFIIVKFKEFNTIDEVSVLSGKELLVEKNAEALPKDHYYFDDLKDFSAISHDGENIGTVVEIIEIAGITNMKIKKRDNKIVKVPFISAFVKNVDMDEKVIIITTIPGLI